MSMHVENILRVVAVTDLESTYRREVGVFVITLKLLAVVGHKFKFK